MEERTDRQILESIERRLRELEAGMDRVPGTAGERETEGEKKKFARRMTLFVVAMNLVFALLTFLCYVFLPELFAVTFGLFFVFLILATGLAVDAFVLPVDTFRRISSNAIATALFWLSIVFLAVSGVRIGTSIISDPFGGEEAARPVEQVHVPGEAGDTGSGEGSHNGARSSSARSGAAAPSQDAGVQGGSREASR